MVNTLYPCPNSLVRRPPWLYASSVKNETVKRKRTGFHVSLIKVYLLALSFLGWVDSDQLSRESSSLSRKQECTVVTFDGGRKQATKRRLSFSRLFFFWEIHTHRQWIRSKKALIDFILVTMGFDKTFPNFTSPIWQVFSY